MIAVQRATGMQMAASLYARAQGYLARVISFVEWFAEECKEVYREKYPPPPRQAHSSHNAPGGGDGGSNAAELPLFN
jgi:hypothetical protein